MIIKTYFCAKPSYYAGLSNDVKVKCLFTVHKREAYVFGARWAADEAVTWIKATQPTLQSVEIID